MNLDLDGAAIAFRDEVREWLAANVQTVGDRAWERRLFDAGLAAVGWPEEYGGRAAPPLHELLFDEEYHAAGAPVRIGQNGLFLLAPTLLAHGTAEQRARVLPPMARGDQVWAQAWSEPDAGSDLAALRSRARRVAGGWSLSGQKTWSSRAVVADRAFGLFRSAPQERRHRGLTYLMFDLRAPGVTVRPIRQLDGTAGFAEIFLDDVFVPDADVIGEPGDGWRVAMSTAGHERGLSLRGPGRFTAAADRLVRLWLRQTPGAPSTTMPQPRHHPHLYAETTSPPAPTPLPGRPAASVPRLGADIPTPPPTLNQPRAGALRAAEPSPNQASPDAHTPAAPPPADTGPNQPSPDAHTPTTPPPADTRPNQPWLDSGGERVADVWIKARAYRMAAYASLARPVPPSATKVFWSELDVELHETALDLLGPLAETDPEWVAGYLFALAGPIYAGANEIQRDILAQRVLRLPREPR